MCGERESRRARECEWGGRGKVSEVMRSPGHPPLAGPIPVLERHEEGTAPNIPWLNDRTALRCEAKLAEFYDVSKYHVVSLPFSKIIVRAFEFLFHSKAFRSPPPGGEGDQCSPKFRHLLSGTCK